MPLSEISNEVESSIVALAGEWAKESLSDSPVLVDSPQWEDAFNNNFTFFYTILVRSVLQAKNEVAKNTKIVKGKKSVS